MKLSQEFIFAIGLFATVTVMAYVLSGMLFRRKVDPRIARLREQRKPLESDNTVSERKERFTPAINAIGQAAAGPFMPKSEQKQSNLRRQLAMAGFYTSGSMQGVVGAKVICLAVGVAGGYIVGNLIGGIYVWVMTYLGAVVGFMLPTIWLKLRVSKRQQQLESALPDALDLMVVCVEAGLTLDAALQRVGHEIAMAHPEISRELGITHMETRIGVPRIEALRNLGQRTGSPSLQSLAAMLVQTERFGTSIGQALRVHAESLRTKRQYQAEERAAKTTVKLAFPVVLFIFPTLLVVLGGPAFILFLKSPLFTGK